MNEDPSALEIIYEWFKVPTVLLQVHSMAEWPNSYWRGTIQQPHRATDTKKAQNNTQTESNQTGDNLN